MKILKLPIDTKIRCECGCEFEFDTDDVIVNSYYSDCNERKQYYVNCPFCKEECYLETKQEETKHHCADCEYFQAMAYKDELTREWVQQFKCVKGHNTIAVDHTACSDFEEK